MKGTRVPVTGSVLQWAVENSGLSVEALCHKLKIEPETLHAWIAEKERPLLSKFHDLAAKLHRPPAMLLLPEAPTSESRKLEFRHPISKTRGPLQEAELVRIREVERIQETISWTRRELDGQKPALPALISKNDPESAAATMRQRLGISAAKQINFDSDSKALKGWRKAFEDLGILVFQFPLGEKGIRGFSLWDEFAPAVVFSSAWPENVRLFSMMHELGHLLTRTDSACQDIGRAEIKTRAEDDHERWCDRFAAAVLLPWPLLQEIMRAQLGPRVQHIRQYSAVRALARKLNVSVTATVLRLIEKGAADWTLYESIPRNIDQKKPGGGGTGRNRLEIRRDEYGQAVARGFYTAMKEDLITRDDAMGYLKISDSELRSVETSGGKFA